ncbi:MAG: metallophosphoesterase [Pirellulales bacterium]|nr:metallophosphoesterase [Pirellulales bacterium]
MVAARQYIENILTAYRDATEANLHTPERVGNVVVQTADSCDEVMLTGDLHGHRQNFNRIKKIAALDRHPRRHLVLQEVCHGGPVYRENGGCMSHTLLEDVAALKVKYPRQVHFLLGNHELAEMTDYPIQKNKQMLNLQFRLGLQQMYGPEIEKVREAYLPFLQSCPLAVRLPHGIFVSHSIPEACDTRPFDATIFDREIGYMEYFEQSGVFHLVWGRDYRQENARAFAELVGASILINGHEPCYEGFGAPNDYQIVLDCCGEKAGYVILSTDRPWTHEEIMERVQLLK